MVGTARFELATSRTPSVRATRLRYVPTSWKPPLQIRGGPSISRLSLAFEERQETAQAFTQFEQHLPAELRCFFFDGRGA